MESELEKLPIYEWDCNLRELLKEWKLEKILSHLKAEEIDLDILEMMKISHIKPLLCNFPLGVQIRFEYNLEQWRRAIGKPMVHDSNDDDETHKQPDSLKRKNTVTILRPSSKSKNRPTDVNKDDAIKRYLQKNQNKNYTTYTTSRKTSAINAANVCIKPFRIKSRVAIPLGASLGHKNLYNKYNVNLEEILSDMPSGVKLMDNYRKSKSFTDEERTQLISIIANYYVKYKLTLGLQKSYAVEMAVLEMFPSETLDLYRTSKHGRIYCKFLNCMFKKNDKGVINFDADDLSDDSEIITADNETESTVFDVTHLDEEENGVLMEEDEYTVDLINEDGQTVKFEKDLEPDIKVEPEYVIC